MGRCRCKCVLRAVLTALVTVLVLTRVLTTTGIFTTSPVPSPGPSVYLHGGNSDQVLRSRKSNTKSGVGSRRAAPARQAGRSPNMGSIVAPTRTLRGWTGRHPDLGSFGAPGGPLIRWTGKQPNIGSMSAGFLDPINLLGRLGQDDEPQLELVEGEKVDWDLGRKHNWEVRRIPSRNLPALWGRIHGQRGQDKDSLMYGVNLTAIYTNTIQGGPMNPLSNYHSHCWIEALPEDIEHIFSHSKQPFCINKKQLNYLINVYLERKNLVQPYRVRCLPYVYVAGVTKSGTTDLLKFLQRHPRIHKPACKEPMWWSLHRQYSDRTTFSDYLVAFEHASYKIEQNVIKTGSGNYHPDITVDGSSYLFWNDAAWQEIPANQGLLTPQYLTMDTLRLVQPSARIVVLLRNPADRLLSHFAMMTSVDKQSINMSHFHDSVVEAITSFNKCLDANNLRTCVYMMVADPPKHEIYLHGSLYYVHLEDWLSRFPREQILVLKAEHYFTHRTPVLNTIFRFLDLELVKDLSESGLSENELAPTFQRRDRSPMYGSTRQMLHQFFAPYNRQLAHVLQDETFLWRDH